MILRCIPDSNVVGAARREAHPGRGLYVQGKMRSLWLPLTADR